MSAGMPNRPWPPTLALSWRYMDAARTVQYERARRRSDAYREAAAVKLTCANVAGDLGVEHFSEHARTVLQVHPIEPGPEWLARAARMLADLADP